MGHEIDGILTNSVDSKKFKIGNRVIFWVNLYCRKCDLCMQGK